MSVGWRDVVVFIAECGCYAAVGTLGWRVHPVVGVVAVLVMALWWSTFHSPRAAINLAAASDAALRLAWFAIGDTATAALVGWGSVHRVLA